jgi:hypothetical protein
MMLKRLLKNIRGLWVRFRGRPAALKREIERANALCLKNKKRYRVFFLNGRYTSMTRTQVQWKKHTGDWGRHVNMTKMEPMEFYDTLDGMSTIGKKVLNHKKHRNGIFDHQ